jgi:hypothetical protein
MPAMGPLEDQRLTVSERRTTARARRSASRPLPHTVRAQLKTMLKNRAIYVSFIGWVTLGAAGCGHTNTAPAQDASEVSPNKTGADGPRAEPAPVVESPLNADPAEPSGSGQPASNSTGLAVTPAIPPVLGASQEDAPTEQGDMPINSGAGNATPLSGDDRGSEPH